MRSVGASQELGYNISLRSALRIYRLQAATGSNYTGGWVHLHGANREIRGVFECLLLRNVVSDASGYALQRMAKWGQSTVLEGGWVRNRVGTMHMELRSVTGG